MFCRHNFSEEIETRVIESAFHIYETGDTIRQTAEKMEVSKTTTHVDVTERLKIIDSKFAGEIRLILDKHIEERSVRGGIAAQRKKSGSA